MIITTSQDTEDYVLQFSFLVGGIFVIANTSAVMYRSLIKFCTMKEGSSHEYKISALETDHKYSSNNASYLGNNCVSNSNHLMSGLRHRKFSHSLEDEAMTTAQNNYKIFSTEKNFLPIVDERKLYDLKLIKLFSICCFFENVCILTSAVFAHNLTDHELTEACNISSEAEDCIMMSSILLLRKTYLSSVFGTLGLTSVSVFPVIFYLMTHCFKSYFKSFVCSIIILFFVLLSRCFSFLLFPLFILPITWHGYTLQRLLSSWIAFLSMGIGVKLTFQAIAQPIQEQMHIQKVDPTYPEDKPLVTEASSMKSAEKESIRHRSKRYSGRSNPELTFGSDAFVPCVVLMKKENGHQSYKQTTTTGTSINAPRSRRRASLSVIKEKNNVEEAVKWSKVMHKRRTSLPTNLAGSKKKAVMSSVLIDTSTLAEIHSVVDELSKISSNCFDSVKKLQDLLHPYKSDHIKPRQVFWIQKSGDGSDEEATGLSMSPRHVTSKRTPQRRMDWQSGLFSTTTTATGLPKEEPGPLKSKRLPKIPKDRTPIGTPIDSRCSSPVGEDLSSYHLGRRRTYPSLLVSNSPKFSFAHSHVHHHSITKRISTISSDYESDDPTSLLIPSPAVSRSKSTTDNTDCISPIYRHYLPENNSPNSVSANQEFFSIRTVVTPPDTENHAIQEEEDGRHGNQCMYEQMDEGHVFFHDYQEKLLESVYNWNFQIFELAEKTNCGLSQMAFKVFQDTGLFETFNIPKKEFVCYMKALENGYREIPYHNRIHAADVLHGCWFLSTQEIPGFHNRSPLFSSDSSDSDSGTSATNTRQVNNIGHGSLAQAIPALELMSLYLAAAMHDYDHPGRTNAFLVETRHPLAILYNDRSVLENHHASASWELLYSNKNFEFLRSLEIAEWKRLRFLIVEAILATDLKKHFEILSQFSAKADTSLPNSTSAEDPDIDSVKRTGIDWSADEDRLLVCKMVIKLADIGGPAKSKPIHVTWTKAICEEFFIQGDEEKRLNAPVSLYMDREYPKVAELQRTFINNLIHPIISSMHEAGILAGEIPEDHDLWIDKHQSSNQNLLLGQLTSNLNFWKTKTPFDGHEEMEEAFKHALSLRLGDNRFSTDKESRSFSKDEKPTRKDYSHRPRDNVDDDEVFESVATKRDKKSVTSSKLDVVRTSSDPLADREKTLLQTPKVIVAATNSRSIRTHLSVHKDS